MSASSTAYVHDLTARAGFNQMSNFISLIATPAEVASLADLARQTQGVKLVSKPMKLDASQALNAGITMEDVKNVLEIIKIVFETGGACLIFLAAARDHLRESGGSVRVADAKSGKLLGEIEGTTADASLPRVRSS
jgi:hypothetical protein